MADNRKQSSDEIATIASRVMRMAKRGGPIKVHHERLRTALLSSGHLTPESVLDTMKRELQPYIDDAESLAASVVAQARPGPNKK